ncbi:hypothetical protein EDC04DRAFT_2608262 [Pisolithus marmoratus]|nr:hypothetical protein EDC04DRAFT_2608262 [Pisolithus marmoratus]
MACHKFKLAAAGGQHRLYALAKWYDIKCKQLAKWKQEEEVSVLLADADTIGEDVINELNKRIAQCENPRRCAGGASGSSCFMTKVCVLLLIFRAHCAADKTLKDINDLAHAKGTPTKQRELLKLDYM